MQEVRFPDGRLEREFFTGRRDRDIHEAMDARLSQLQGEGAELSRRTKIGRNATCPCGSGRKFKKCCITGARVVPAGRAR